MKPHQERVVTEKMELDEKIDKLKAFIDSNPNFATLDDAERERMRRQYGAMSEYTVVLGERIAAFA